jgi:hypothetical protein
MRDDIAKLHELERKYRWRDVNKELPEDQRCIVYDKTISLTLEVAALNGVFYENGEQIPIGDITHWMPMPEFKEEGK